MSRSTIFQSCRDGVNASGFNQYCRELMCRECCLLQCQAWPVLLQGKDLIGIAQVCIVGHSFTSP